MKHAKHIRRLRSAVRKVSFGFAAPAVLLVLMMAAYIAVFTAAVFSEYNMFWYGNYDLGIQDQGIWMLSQLKSPYMTARGMNLFGDHASYIHILIAPFYWLWDDAKALLFLHTAALALGAVPVYLIARKKVDSGWTPLAFSFLYLMYPALHYSNLDQGYHYESLTVPLVLLAYYFLIEGKHNLFYASSFLAIICKEGMALSFMLIGAYIYFRHDRRVGAITATFSLAYLLISMFVLIPAFEKDGTSHNIRTMVGSFGSTPAEIMSKAANPFFMYGKIFTERNAAYFFDLLFPVAFIALYDAGFLVLSASFFVNIISDWYYSHQIEYHYVSPVIPFVFIATINAVSKHRKDRLVTYSLLLLMAGTTLVSNVVIGPPEARITDYSRIKDGLLRFNYVSEDDRSVLQLMEMIPKDASVSTTYNWVSHLTHREKAYMFPNPFQTYLYGIDEKGVHPDRDVNYVLLDTRLVQEDEGQRQVAESIKAGGRYELIGEYKYAQLWRRRE